MGRIAIVGAGLAGLVVARGLERDHDVTLFEKSRGVGGRMATRYAGDFEFDHGTQFFTARTAALQAFLEPLLADGIVAHWPAQFVELCGGEKTALRRWDSEFPHFVGVPRMNAVGKYLARGLDVRLETRVTALQSIDGRWTLTTNDNHSADEFDWVILTAPAEQTTALAPADSEPHQAAAAAPMRGCCALMLGFETAPALDWHAALVRQADISWISINSSKPGRGPNPTMVVHSTNRWADAHFDMDRDRVISHMGTQLERVAGVKIAASVHCELHRWRYANADKRNAGTFSLDAHRRVAACGDWFIRGRVEAAFTSANNLLKALRKQLAT